MPDGATYLLDKQTGKTVEVDPFSVAAKVESGAFELIPDQLYRMDKGGGQYVDVLGRQVGEAMLTHSWSFPVWEERAGELEEEARERQYGGILGGLTAGTAGFARGITGGLSDVALGEMGIGRELAEFEEAHPGISTASEIAGVVVGAVPTGGAAVATPVGQMARLGRGIAGKGAGKGLGARTGYAALGYGSEGALYGAGHFFSDVALDKKDATAEAFLDDTLTGAAFGAGIGAGFTVAGAGLKAVTKPKGPPPGKTLGDPMPEGKLQGAVLRAEREEAKAARLAGKTVREPGLEGALQGAIQKERVAANKLLTKQMRGPKAQRAANENFERQVGKSQRVGDELEEIAQRHVGAGDLNPRGAHYAAKLDDALRSFRVERDRFLAEYAKHGKPLKAGPHTRIYEENMLALAREHADVLSAADRMAIRQAARPYGKGIAARHRAAKEAEAFGPVAQRKAAQQALIVPPESEMMKGLKEIGRVARRMREPASKKAAKLPSIMRKAPTVPGKRPRVAADQVTMLDELHAGGLRADQMSTIAGKRITPKLTPQILKAPPEAMTLGPSRMATVEAIEGYEKAQFELYQALKPGLQESTKKRMSQHFAPMEEAASEAAKSRGKFQGVKDALGAAEALQMMGVPGVPDVGKIPVVGPLLDAYAKWRMVRLAAKKVGIGRSADSNVAERATKVRDRVSDGVERVLKKAPKAKPAAVPTAMAILSSPLFAGGVERTTPRKKQKLTAAELFKRRAAEIRQAEAAGVAGFRRHVNVENPRLQAELEKAYITRIKFLADRVPMDPRLPSLLGIPSTWQPPPDILREFAEFVDGAMHPSKVVERLENKTLTPQFVEAMKVTNPAMFAEVQEQLVEQRIELQAELDRSMLTQLSLLFETPLHPTLEPEYIAAAQEAHKPTEPAPQPQPSFAGPGLGQAEMWGAHSRMGK